jgi:alkanesulfonate monooxygenase SsuD/methylene tetrahydromethanopterin reductase-like flavin-dependent oxidoreductase (luciferase family)
MAYAEIIELFIWAETLGFGAAYIFEHHFTDDDYISSPMVAATAIAARTKHMRVGPDIAILPLYDPVRVAEGGAVLDLISNGRFDFGVGLGYRPQEYAGYGLDISRKGARANEALQIIRSLWQGDRHLPWQAFQCRWRQALAPPGPAAESAHLGWRLQPRGGAPRRSSWRWLRRTLESDGLRNVSR